MHVPVVLNSFIFFLRFVVHVTFHYLVYHKSAVLSTNKKPLAETHWHESFTVIHQNIQRQARNLGVFSVNFFVLKGSNSTQSVV